MNKIIVIVVGILILGPLYFLNGCPPNPNPSDFNGGSGNGVFLTKDGVIIHRNGWDMEALLGVGFSLVFFFVMIFIIKEGLKNQLSVF